MASVGTKLGAVPYCRGRPQLSGHRTDANTETGSLFLNFWSVLETGSSAERRLGMVGICPDYTWGNQRSAGLVPQ